MSLFLAGPTGFLIWFLGNFWSGVAVGLTTTLLAFLIKLLVRAVMTRLARKGRFSLAGIWIGTCELPNYPPGVVAIEIYRLVVRGDHVSFKFFNYRPDINKISEYVGAGICRGQLLSAYYYIPLPQRSESGVFAVRKVGELLKGVYAQYDLRANEELKVSPENFYLVRAEMPLWERLRMAVRKPPYLNFEQAKKLYEGALAANALGPVAG